MAKLKLKASQRKDIEKFLQSRFSHLEKLRSPLDTEVEEEYDVYNNKDKNQDDKNSWEETSYLPYVYTITQTIKARVVQSLFPDQNYIRSFMERDEYKGIEKEFEQWAQEELDIIRFRQRASDFIEDGLAFRGCWLQLRPMKDKLRQRLKIDFDVINFFDIWYDTFSQDIEDTDVFIRKIVKLWQLQSDDMNYFNIEKIKAKDIEPPDYIKKRQIYKSKNGVTYYDPVRDNVTDDVELLEWYGVYNLNPDPEGKPDFKNVIFTLANRSLLVRAETNDMKTKRKKLLFPIRPFKQAHSLVPKSVGQLIKSIQYDINETRALRMTNFKLKVKLLFKYNKNADINFKEMFAKGGNAIGFDDNPDDVSLFDVPDMVQMATFMNAELIQEAQQITGAVDYLMGTTAGRGVTETATGIKTITEQAMFKMSMVTENVYYDVLDFINFLLILKTKYDTPEIIAKHPLLNEIIDRPEDEIEDSRIIDINLKDLSVRRDVERAQFINFSNIILPVLERVGGNIKEFLRQAMDRLQMERIDKMLEPAPEIQQLTQAIANAMSKDPSIGQMIMMILQNPEIAKQAMAGGGGTPNPAQEKPPEQTEEFNVIPST